MANATQITSGGTTYTVKDAEARSGISGFQKDAENMAEVDRTLFGNGYMYNFDNWRFHVNDYATGQIYPATVGATISFGSNASIRHFYIDVVAGEIYRVTLKKPDWLDGTSCIVFTDSNGVVISPIEQVNGVQVVIHHIVAVPDGATRMYIMSQDTGGANSGSTNVYKARMNGVVGNNNLAGTMVTGYWLGADISTRGGTNQNYRSISEVLEPGEYTLTFEVAVELIRVCIDGGFCDKTVMLAAGEPFTVRCLKSGNTGFSFIKQDSGVWNDEWVLLERTGVTLGHYTETAVDVELRKQALNGVQPLKIKTIGRNSLINGYWNGNNYTKSDNRLTTFNFIPVKKGDIAILKNDEIAIAFITFDSNKQFIKSTDYISVVYYSAGAVEARMHVFDCDGYVTYNMYNRVAGGSASISRNDYDNFVEIINFVDAQRLCTYMDTAMMCNMRAKYYNGRTINGQGGCVIGNKLYSFADGESQAGAINIVNLDTMENDGTGSHQLGHANSVDYFDAVDTLIAYGAEGTNKPTIVLYQHPDFSTTLELTDAGCVVIPLYNNSGFMNVSASVCFGESPQIAYFMEGCYTNAAQAANPVRNIYKILLGMGSNNLASEGYGTYISGKGDDEYNGTCKILKTYTGEIIPGVHCFANANSLWTPQDMKFDGYLFVGYGTAGNNNLKIQLDDHSDSYTVVNNYHFEVLATNGDIVPCEPELLALYGNKMVCGVSNRGSHANLLFTLDMR